MVDWKISGRRGVCSACERPFEDGEAVISSLRVTAEGLERVDVCRALWEGHPEHARGEACRAACAARTQGEGQTQEVGEGALFWWAARHRLAKRRTIQLDLESLERLFDELEGHAELAVRELRYVLCLLLMRKRRLKVVKVERDAEGEFFVVKKPKREERYRVFAYDLGPDRLEEVRRRLQALFDGDPVGGGLAPEEAPEEAPAEGDEEVEPADGSSGAPVGGTVEAVE